MSLSRPNLSGQNPEWGHTGWGNPAGEQPNFLKQAFGREHADLSPQSPLQPQMPQPWTPGSPDTPAAMQPPQGVPLHNSGTTAQPTPAPSQQSINPAQMQQIIQQLTMQSQVPNGTMGMQQQQAGTLTYPTASGGSSVMPFGA